MPSVEIVAVGTELLLGQLLDTNTQHIAAVLAGAGIDVHGTQTVGDNRERIANAIRGSLARADGVITSGGLGPTVDDLTKEAVCDALGVEPVLHAASLQSIEAAFARLGRTMRENNRKQAMLPPGAYVLENDNGTAPGFIVFARDGKFAASMPGVPREMKPMLADRLLPYLRERLHLHGGIHTRVLHTIGIAESEIDHRIDDLFRTLDNPKIAVLAHDYRCDVKIMAKADSATKAAALIDPVQRELEARLDGVVYGYDGESLAAVIHRLLQQRGETIAASESCTGGAVSVALTAVPGASSSFVGGLIPYANEIKIDASGVTRATLEHAGAVSEAVAREMAVGIRRRFGATHGIATTGIAGPTGGSAQKPVGLVWLALASADDSIVVRKLQVPGDRAAVTARATTAALGLLWNTLREREQRHASGS